MKILDLHKKNGQLSLQILIFGSIAVILLSGFFVWVEVSVKSAVRQLNRSTAFTIAEAGIEYYRWHLAHDQDDYQDGTGQSGPYIHDYYDKDGNLIGQFILEITPPPIGSSVVNIKSTGKIVKDSSIEKAISVKMAIPSFAKYAAVINTNVGFGAGTEVYGEIHSNGGVRFNGVAHNLVTSALASYDDPDHSGGNEFGVHTHAAPVDPLPPAAVPDRPDIFQVGRNFPVPAVDFTGLTQTLSQIKSDAQASGLYFASSTSYGYHIVLKTDDTFDLYRVNSLVAPPNLTYCINWGGEARWGTWSINTQTLIGNYALPANGLIFLEDNVWVNGQINTARLTIASGRFPESQSTYTNIIITNDLLYTNYDGQDVISLIAQGDVGIGLRSEDDLRVDAALVAQNGRVGRNFYYYSYCGVEAHRTTITLYGMIATSQRYVLNWGCGGSCWSGYINRNLVYDVNLLYNPPPSFPKTSDSYETIYWDEVK